jgi:hypothetical protein
LPTSLSEYLTTMICEWLALSGPRNVPPGGSTT